MTWSIYCGAIGALFLIVKLFNARLHYLFDTTDPTAEPVDEISLPNLSNGEEGKVESGRAYDLEKGEE